MGCIGALALFIPTPERMLEGAARAETLGAHAPLRRLADITNAEKPKFTFSDLAGSPLKLQEQRGRIVLVHFFATWCEPCGEELSSLSRLMEGRLAERLSVVAVNVVACDPARAHAIARSIRDAGYPGVRAIGLAQGGSPAIQVVE